MTVTIRAAEPSDFTDQERERFQELVVEGGEVMGVALTTNITTARVLVMLSQNGVIRGVAALKRPQDSYRKKISAAGFDLPKPAYPFELGYIYLEPGLRGQRLSPQLVSEALVHGYGKAIFATVRMDNGAMRAALAKAGFKNAGSPYEGLQGNMIGILVRPGQEAHSGNLKDGLWDKTAIHQKQGERRLLTKSDLRISSGAARPIDAPIIRRI